MQLIANVWRVGRVDRRQGLGSRVVASAQVQVRGWAREHASQVRAASWDWPFDVGARYDG